jgi:hypothetical protein
MQQPPLAAAYRMTIAGLIVIYAICVPSLSASNFAATKPCVYCLGRQYTNSGE